MSYILKILFLCSISAPLLGGVLDYCPAPSDMPEWIYEFEPEIYSPENLHEHINGEAELYKKYDFVEMVTVSYVDVNRAEITFSVDIYDMGKPLNAFGTYSVRRRPGMTLADIGYEAMISEMTVRFWKGRYFVQIVAGARDSLLTQTIEHVARKIAQTLPAEAAPPELEILPTEDKIAGSMQYLVKDWNGPRSARVLSAQYSINGSKLTAFVLLFQSHTVATEAFKYLVKKTDILIQQKHQYLIGVSDFAAVEHAEKLLSKFKLPQ